MCYTLVYIFVTLPHLHSEELILNNLSSFNGAHGLTAKSDKCTHVIVSLKAQKEIGPFEVEVSF